MALTVNQTTKANELEAQIKAFKDELLKNKTTMGGVGSYVWNTTEEMLKKLTELRGA